MRLQYRRSGVCGPVDGTVFYSTVAAVHTLSQFQMLVPVGDWQAGAGSAAAGQSAEGAAVPARWDATGWCQWPSPAAPFFGCGTTTIMDCESDWAAGLQRCEGGCGPGEAAEWRWGCPADVAYGLDRSPRKERSKKSMQAGAAAAGPIFQRVTHRNRQVNVLVVVASAALAAAVYDAALATYLAAHNSPPPLPPPPSPPKLSPPPDGRVARGLGLQLLALAPLLVVLFVLELLQLQLRKARVVTVSSTYHSRTVCARAVCTCTGTYACHQ